MDALEKIGFKKVGQFNGYNRVYRNNKESVYIGFYKSGHWYVEMKRTADEATIEMREDELLACAEIINELKQKDIPSGLPSFC